MAFGSPVAAGDRHQAVAEQDHQKADSVAVRQRSNEGHRIVLALYVAFYDLYHEDHTDQGDHNVELEVPLQRGH